MKRTLLAPLALLLAALPLAAQATAQDATPKIGGLFQLWLTQMMDSNLRNDAPATTNGNKYYDLSSNYTENGLNLRRAELNVSGAVPTVAGLTYFINFDPSISTNPGNPSILQDAYLAYACGSFSAKAGQMKNLRTYEAFTSSASLIFAERSQLARRLGDKRDRGLIAAYAFGDEAFGAKVSAGVFNGMNDATSGKTGDANAQKDFSARVDFNLGTVQKFGLWAFEGGTDQADKGNLTALTFSGPGAPTSAEVLDKKDRAFQAGAYYAYDLNGWHFDGEVATGNLGRLAPSLAQVAGPARREALDQKFLGYYATAAYTTGAHTFALRYDTMDYNAGDDWTTAFDPYTESAQGVSRGGDYSPKYTEVTAGYTYAFNPKLIKAANLKANYIHRSKNFLAPGPGQTGEQGGDSVVIAFQIAF